jgi:hypothetical protein
VVGIEIQVQERGTVRVGCLEGKAGLEFSLGEGGDAGTWEDFPRTFPPEGLENILHNYTDAL